MFMVGNKIIAVDLGGTNTRVGLVKGNRVLKYIKEKTPDNKKDLMKLLSGLIRGLISKDVKGIGVASPGPLKDGIIKNPPNLPVRNFNIKKFLENEFKVRVAVANDADCVALSEARFGFKKKNFVILTLGTGIGGGIVINGELYTGQGYGGELGHMVLNDKNFEKYWQDNRQRSKKCFGKTLLVKDLLEMRDKQAKEIIDDTVVLLGKGIASLINIFDPEIVVLMGGIRETGEKFLRKVRAKAKEYVLIPHFPKIKWTKLEHPGILGASLLIK